MFPIKNRIADLSVIDLRALSRGLLAAVVLTGLLLTGPARAGETPAETVQTVNDALLHVMKNAEALGFQGRQAYLTPVLTETFDLPAMARLAAGRYWDRFDNDEKRNLVTYFTDLSISTFAARFDGYSGETWQIEGTSEAPRGGTIVENRLITGRGEIFAINYLMRQTESGDWRIIDVYLDGNISELALRRSEFNSVLRNGGVDHLLDQIAQQVGRLSNTPQTN